MGCHAPCNVDQLYKQHDECHVTLSTGLALYKRHIKVPSSRKHHYQAGIILRSAKRISASLDIPSSATRVIARAAS